MMASLKELAIGNLRRAGLDEVLYTPGQETYENRTASYWSETARLRPWAIVQPRSADEVSQAVKAMVETPDCKFAVRSGGHTVFPGASNIQDGVTIDLGLMAKTSYDHDTELASLLPGGTWTDAYQEVVNYEIVLADGSIVQANVDENSDLFRVLKGGGNNFGIVTRFDLVTFPSNEIWDARLVCAKESTPDVVAALADFIGNLEAHPDAHILAMWMYMPRTKYHFIMNLLTSLDGEQEAQCLAKFLVIPGEKDAKTTTVADKMAAFALPKSRRQTWFTLTFRNDTRIIQKAANVFEDRIEKMKAQIPDHDFHFSMVLQPLPASFGKHSAVRGGNMFGLERIKEDCVLLVWAIEVDTQELRNSVGFPTLKGGIDEIEAFAKSVNGDVGFRYLNYCDGSQDPLGSYGEENVRKMREAAERYDPAGVFQTRVPGGFKISNVTVGREGELTPTEG
ncbi:FAD binding domain-containing protein [Colletotrichum karsti]|uniref:FAD binding domain-containing protein n=1 Tax=Colletotrichum karsti TaxID=1095194 RepID=A0A9P6LQJ2_9PEZI|nr:FAD binding domain-containing protein [Colletotrichum karsti]KAF9882285.1 FAD binding domain-containing protein [Colletotrichum karsti]